MNSLLFRQRLWRAMRKGDWKYVSRTEDESAVNTTIATLGITTGFAATVLSAYHMDGFILKKEHTPFIEAWYVSTCIGCVAGLANCVAMCTPWTAMAFYGTGVPVWAVRKWKKDRQVESKK